MDLLEAVIVVVVSLGALIAKDAWWDSADAPFLANAIHAGFGYEGTDEYQPLGSDRYELPGTNANGEWIAQSPTPRIRQFAVISSGADAISSIAAHFSPPALDADRARVFGASQRTHDARSALARLSRMASSGGWQQSPRSALQIPAKYCSRCLPEPTR